MTPQQKQPHPDKNGPSHPEGKISNADADKIWESAIELFGGNEALARDWMNTEAMALDWRKPIDVMVDDPTAVMDLITRVAYGVYT
ncbi:putative toxin-antitoxin system antitoxin component (TIGR02293 family) [Halomonas ventosae]|uniref:Putative toxin-antitoxin system antitoxin component (TIGR02293 family) n=1 Tax=Halomonas ventosae TaxID=229007 RepID=A0A4R6ZIC9_9GAMM|nr:antitoxin Xre/MbcA/ParS toxin-binding domain-containing protein [Halomonas ventosae]TDR52030.1 putative toxin-antitoxin system antitoxin component (TIGR02293 family) [Halomonas ventosae]